MPQGSPNKGARSISIALNVDGSRDGRDGQGESVPSGVYFSKTIVGGFEKVGKILFLKGEVGP